MTLLRHFYAPLGTSKTTKVYRTIYIPIVHQALRVIRVDRQTDRNTDRQTYRQTTRHTAQE